MSSTLPEPRVLITGAGGPAAISVIRALAPRAELFAVDIDSCAAGLYLVVDAHQALVPRGDDPDFVDVLIELCRDWAIDVLIPTVDCELVPLAATRNRFEAIGTRLVLGPRRAMATCLDKWALSLAVRGLPAPITALIDDEFDPATFPCWPAIVKPRSGSGSRGVRLIETESDFELAGVARDGTLIIQEYLPGAELSVDMYVSADRVPIGAVPRRRLKVDSGVSVAGMTVHDTAAVDLALDVAHAIGLTGPANVQLRCDDDGLLRLLEVNPRFPGSLPLTIRAGFDVPGVALEEALGVRPRQLTSYDQITVVRHLDEVVVPSGSFEAMQLTSRRGSWVTP